MATHHEDVGNRVAILDCPLQHGQPRSRCEQPRSTAGVTVRVLAVAPARVEMGTGAKRGTWTLFIWSILSAFCFTNAGSPSIFPQTFVHQSSSLQPAQTADSPSSPAPGPHQVRTLESLRRARFPARPPPAYLRHLQPTRAPAAWRAFSPARLRRRGARGRGGGGRLPTDDA